MTNDSAPSDKEKVLPLLEETLDVSRREVTTGRVNVSTETRERTETVEAMLAQARVEVEHVEINEYVDEMPETRQEGDTTIIPVVEEVLVVQRRLRLTEEVHVRRVHDRTPWREEVTLREQHAVVTRQDDDITE
ncbi:YsnF/AvaK domain-containing protein [Kushneria sp. AK178]